MATASQSMPIHTDHEPGNAEERVLTVFKREIEEYDQARMSPQLIRRRLEERDVDVTKQNVNYALQQLTAAGWVQKIADGLYEFVEDPRQVSES